MINFMCKKNINLINIFGTIKNISIKTIMNYFNFFVFAELTLQFWYIHLEKSTHPQEMKDVPFLGNTNPLFYSQYTTAYFRI